MGLLSNWPSRAVALCASVSIGVLSAHLTTPITTENSTNTNVSAVPVAKTETDEPARPQAAVERSSPPPEHASEPARDLVRSDLTAGRVITGASRQRIILFTFDDGPDPRYTRRLLDVLDEREVRAVFFLSGERFAGATPWARQNREIVRDIAARGHVLGSHGHRHIQFTRLPGLALVSELDAADAAFVEAIGLRPTLIRPPGGSRSPRTDAVLAGRGYTTVLWNLGTGDAQVRTADEVLETFRNVLLAREHENGNRGGIVLLHDIHAWSVQAFPQILDYLERRNCALYEAGAELYDVIDDPAVFFTARTEAEGASEAAPWAELDAEVHTERQARLRDEAAERCSLLALR